MSRQTTRGPGPSSTLITLDQAGNVVGIDPHKRTLTATIIDPRGGLIASEHFRVSGDGNPAHPRSGGHPFGWPPVRRKDVSGRTSHLGLVVLGASSAAPNRVHARQYQFRPFGSIRAVGSGCDPLVRGACSAPPGSRGDGVVAAEVFDEVARLAVPDACGDSLHGEVGLAQELAALGHPAFGDPPLDATSGLAPDDRGQVTGRQPDRGGGAMASEIGSR